MPSGMYPRALLFAGHSGREKENSGQLSYVDLRHVLKKLKFNNHILSRRFPTSACRSRRDTRTGPIPLSRVTYSTCVPQRVRTVAGKERPLVRIQCPRFGVAQVVQKSVNPCPINISAGSIPAPGICKSEVFAYGVSLVFQNTVKSLWVNVLRGSTPRINMERM
jgi:hypothetical protein